MSEVQFLERDGKKEFAVVPIETWRRMVAALEEREDQAAVDRWLKSDRETIPADVVKRIAVRQENPIKVYREWRGLSQGKLAKQAKLKQAFISLVERGERKLGRDSARKIAAALGVDEDMLE